jgi:hypothetical protein
MDQDGETEKKVQCFNSFGFLGRTADVIAEDPLFSQQPVQLTR